MISQKMFQLVRARGPNEDFIQSLGYNWKDSHASPASETFRLPLENSLGALLNFDTFEIVRNYQITSSEGKLFIEGEGTSSGRMTSDHEKETFPIIRRRPKYILCKKA